jgi:hypothetical protein
MATKTEKRKQDGVQHSAQWRALFSLKEWLRVPMAVLGAIWLAILILVLTGNSNAALTVVGTVIWSFSSSNSSFGWSSRLRGCGSSNATS